MFVKLASVAISISYELAEVIPHSVCGVVVTSTAISIGTVNIGAGGIPSNISINKFVVEVSTPSVPITSKG